MKHNSIWLVLFLLICFGTLGCSQIISDKPAPAAKAASSADVPAKTEQQTPANQTAPNTQKCEPAPCGMVNEMKTDSGRYTGQADSNFIEIQISGVPTEIEFKVFMLSKELKEKFADLGLESGQNVKFDYFVNKNKQNVICKIEKI